MKLIMENWRKFTLNERLKLGYKVERMASRLPKSMYIEKHWEGSILHFTLFEKVGENENSVVGELHVEKVLVLGKHAYEGAFSEVEKGYGPLLYELALEHASKDSLGFKPDSVDVSDEAQGVWDIYNVRDDVESIELDYDKQEFEYGAGDGASDYVRQRTPDDPEDDYNLDSALKSSGAYDYVESDEKKPNGFDKWMDLSITKIYRKNNDNITKKLRERGQLVEK